MASCNLQNFAKSNFFCEIWWMSLITISPASNKNPNLEWSGTNRPPHEKIWKKHYYIWPVPNLHIFFQKNASCCISEVLNYQMEIFYQRKEELKSQNCCAMAKLFSYIFIKYFVYKRPGKTYALERIVKKPSISLREISAGWSNTAARPLSLKLEVITLTFSCAFIARTINTLE